MVYLAVKSFSIRIEEEMLEKISYIADYEGRSSNSHVLCLIRDNIKSFENEHGEIKGKVKPVDNVKTSRKQ